MNVEDWKNAMADCQLSNIAQKRADDAKSKQINPNVVSALRHVQIEPLALPPAQVPPMF